MSVSTLMISDIDRFVGMKSFWDREIKEHADSPFLCSSMLIEDWELGQSLGWHPFLIVFLSDENIVGFAPLKMRSRFGFRQACNLHEFIFPDFFVDNCRKSCVDSLIYFLFKRLNCESVDLTFEDGSVNQRVFEWSCGRRGLSYARLPSQNKAFIPVDTSWESFQSSLGSLKRRKFRKMAEKFAGLKTWKIYSAKLDSSSIRRIWEVEKYSWKENLTGRAKALKNFDLAHFLASAEKESKSGGFFESEVWFLDLNDAPIAYALVLERNATAFCAKTSFDSRFGNLVPGKFLINDLIKRVFRDKAAAKIDFIGDQPFLRDWKPFIRNNTTVRVERNPQVSKIRHLLFENQISFKSISFLEGLKWKKLYP